MSGEGLGPCIYCFEPVLEAEPHERRPVLGKALTLGAIHRECEARGVLGSVGHQMGLCSCRGGPGTMDDPPGLTRRQAARAALDYARGISSPARPAGGKSG